ncbi:hypothetical protein SMICM17S_00990 [Streptomyces microflavus]
MGFIGAVGALGGLAINLVFRQSFQASGTGTAAFWSFLAFYAVCSALTWAVYPRRPAAVPAKPQDPLRRGVAALQEGDAPATGDVTAGK